MALARAGAGAATAPWAPDVVWHHYDPASRDRASFVRALDGVGVVYDLAGSSGAVASNRDPVDSLEANCRQQLELLEACRLVGSCPHIVFASSRLVYARGAQLPVNESAPIQPRSAYAAHKLCIEHYLPIFASLDAVTYTIARISNPFGSDDGQKEHGFINALIARARAAMPLRLFGDGAQIRDYLYIADLVDALIRCGEHPAARNELFNIGRGQGVSIVDAARRIRARAATRAAIEFAPWPAEYERVESGDYVADITKAAVTLGFRPRYDFDAGLEEMFDTVSPAIAMAGAGVPQPAIAWRSAHADGR